MATREQLITALKNADKAGDVEAAKKLAAAIRQMAPAPVQEQPAEIPLEQQRENVAKGITLRPFGIDTGIEMPQWMTEGLAGAGRRLTQAGTLGTHKTPEAAAKLLDDSTAATIGGAVADIGIMAALGGGAGLAAKGLSAAPKLATGAEFIAKGLSAPQTLRQATIMPALYGASTSEDRMTGALGGAIGGAAGHGITKTAAGILSPQWGKGVDALNKSGVQMTPGQIMGKWAKRIEDSMTSIPVVGSFVNSAQRKSMESFNRSVINDALSFAGERLDDATPAGRKAIDEALRKVSSKYDDVLDRMTVQMDPQLNADLSKISGMVSSFRDDVKSLFQRKIDETIGTKFNNPTQTALGRDFKTVQREIRTWYEKWLESDDPFIQEAGKAAREVFLSLKNASLRQNPNYQPVVNKLDTSWAALKRVTGAAKMAGAQDGVFTPAMLLRSIRSSSMGDDFARGRAFGQEMTEMAQDVLPKTVADSGTTERALTNLALASGGGALAGVPPAVIAAGAGLAGAYTPPAQNILRALLTQRPQSMRLARPIYEQYSPAIRLLGGAGGVQVGKE